MSLHVRQAGRTFRSNVFWTCFEFGSTTCDTLCDTGLECDNGLHVPIFVVVWEQESCNTNTCIGHKLTSHMACLSQSACRDAEYWGSLAGVDGAALVEVVEHLDPTPLHNLGPCLLGGLQPKLLVVTTPNREYNAVLHQLGNALLPNKLRNTDHRFEW